MAWVFYKECLSCCLKPPVFPPNTRDETCYLFLTHTTVNAGDVVQSGNAEDDAALQIIKYLLEE